MFSNLAGALPAAWDVIQENHCRRIEGRVIIEETKKGLRLVMAWLQLLPVAFVAILGLVALYALSSGPARQ
jgi:hypothetical protein